MKFSIFGPFKASASSCIGVNFLSLIGNMINVHFHVTYFSGKQPSHDDDDDDDAYLITTNHG